MRTNQTGPLNYARLPAAKGCSLVLIQAQSPSAVATLDFTSGIVSTYDEYILELCNFVPATNTVDLWLRLSTDGGSTFFGSASDYVWGCTGIDNGGTIRSSSSTGAAFTAAIVLNAAGATGVSNTSADGGLNMTIHLKKLSTTTQNKHVYYKGDYVGSTVLTSISGAGVTQVAGLRTSAVNAIRLLFSSGNITSGDAYLYGVKKF